MTSSWDWKTNISINAISKTMIASSGTFPPNYVRGALYAGAESDPNLYLYGGTSSFVNTSFPGFFYPIPPLYSLWLYDSSGHSWDRYDTSLKLPYRPAGGAYAEATDRGLGFYLSGFIDQGSDSDYVNLTNFRQYMNGLVVVNTTSQNAVNISTSSLKDSPRVMGGLAYLPNVGSKGVVMAMGGLTKSPSNRDLSDNGTYVRDFRTQTSKILARSSSGANLCVTYRYPLIVSTSLTSHRSTSQIRIVTPALGIYTSHDRYHPRASHRLLRDCRFSTG